MSILTKTINGIRVELTEEESALLKSEEDAAKTEGKRIEIITALSALDTAAIRPTRAILAAQLAGVTPDEADTARLAEIEEQAKALRDELAGLDGITEE